MVICLGSSADGPADAIAIQNPTVSRLIETQNDFTFLMPTYPSYHAKEAIKWVFFCQKYNLLLLVKPFIVWLQYRLVMLVVY